MLTSSGLHSSDFQHITTTGLPLTEVQQTPLENCLGISREERTSDEVLKQGIEDLVILVEENQTNPNEKPKPPDTT